MQQYQSAGQIGSPDTPNDTVNRLLRQAEIFRLTRNLKTKLAFASQKAQKTPDKKSAQSDLRRRSKTLEGASPSPRPVDTPLSTRPRSSSRRSSINSISSVSSMGSASSIASPRARIPRISSVNSIAEAQFEELDETQFLSNGNSAPGQFQSVQSQQWQRQKQRQFQLQMQYEQQQQQMQMQQQEQQFRQQQEMRRQQQLFEKQSIVQQQRQQRHQREHNQHEHNQHELNQHELNQHELNQHDLNQHERRHSQLSGFNGLNPPVQFPDHILSGEKLSSNASDTRFVARGKNLQDSSSSSFSLDQQSREGTPFSSRLAAAQSAQTITFNIEDEPLPPEPSTPPPLKRVMPHTPERSSIDASTSDGANLLLHFAHSPGRGTPRTPDFNMSDYLHFQTPSPARGGQLSLTPHRVRWSSLNSALFHQPGAGGNSLVPPMPNLSHPAGSGSEATNS